MSTIDDKPPAAQASKRTPTAGPTTSPFQKLVVVANRTALKFNGSRSTCVLTSLASHDVLQRLGYDSHPLRIEAAVFPDDRKLCGTILGSLCGCRQAASPGMWRGHLAVVVDDEWLLDPTLDQANKKEWPRSMRVAPLVADARPSHWKPLADQIFRAARHDIERAPPQRKDKR